MKVGLICAVQTVIRKSDMGHIWAKKSDLGHFSLQCELSLRGSVWHRNRAFLWTCVSYGESQVHKKWDYP